MLGTATTMSINFIGMAARAMNSNGSHRKPQIPVDYQKLLSIEGITKAINILPTMMGGELRRIKFHIGNC